MDVLDASLTDYLKYVLALVFVLALIGIFAMIARRAGFGLSTSVHGKRQRRLAIVESLNIDGKRKLVLLSRDNTEHLVLLGADNDLLIECAVTPMHNAFTQALNEAAQATRGDGHFDIPSAPGTPQETEPSLDLPPGLINPSRNSDPERGI